MKFSFILSLVFCTLSNVYSSTTRIDCWERGILQEETNKIASVELSQTGIRQSEFLSTGYQCINRLLIKS